jgi:hypothetical protein
MIDSARRVDRRMRCVEILIPTRTLVDLSSASGMESPGTPQLHADFWEEIDAAAERAGELLPSWNGRVVSVSATSDSVSVTFEPGIARIAVDGAEAIELCRRFDLRRAGELE